MIHAIQHLRLSRSNKGLHWSLMGWNPSLGLGLQTTTRLLATWKGLDSI